MTLLSFPPRATILPATAYEILIPGESSDGPRLTSLAGRGLETDFLGTFSTRSTEPFLLDPETGTPEVSAVALDLNGNGTLEADGDPSTADPEELTNLTDAALLFDAPVGLTRAPLTIALLFDEPLLPSSVFEDADNDGRPDHFSLVDATVGITIPHRIQLTQEFLVETERFLTRVSIIPDRTLPPASRIEADATLKATGPAPLRLFATRELTIAGTLDAKGQVGTSGASRAGFEVSAGGAGGGHAERGSDVLGGNNAQGGQPYGDDKISELLGGSGGGAGGDASQGPTFSPRDESTGGGGGGGSGGSIKIEALEFSTENARLTSIGGPKRPPRSSRDGDSSHEMGLSTML